MTLVQKEPKKIYLGNNELKAVYLGDTKVRPAGPDKDYLCFTAEEVNSTIRLKRNNSPTVIELETSEDGATWTDYTRPTYDGTTITLSSIGDKVYFRNKSGAATGFSTATTAYYQFIMTGTISASGDITSLLCKNLTNTLQGIYCFYRLFMGCISLTSSPKLPATTITQNCYYQMFNGCTNLTSIPELPATTLTNSCYAYMFQNCSSIKISSTQTGDYQTEYRIPTTGTGTTATSWNSNMFKYTGGTYTSNPSINMTYYTSNTVV